MRKPLWFTFGNHMHWVDMQWLWGYHVLPGSVRDMLALIEATGTKGCVNFDGVGYEKMAAECPDALAELRAAVHDGRVEVVGASYGQPYGLFHGGESNIRQRVYGIRAVMRTLGVRPRAFWEEEFDFCPQLPQILAGCGFTGASLFFQWTWHTPEVPKEEASLILWEGLDGTRLPTLPRNDLNLHQWPEDFDAILDSPLIAKLDKPALVQWVELMPSPDWMCRSEVLLPRLKELLADPRFDIRPATLSGLIEAIGTDDAPVRRYTLDDVWHGVSLGKNDDHHPRTSLRAEAEILAAESLAATASLLGRPYPRWDVYPTWELEEAWRHLLVYQHHDNHECEGLCGDIVEERGTFAAWNVRDRTLRSLAARHRGRSLLVTNPLGWTRDIVKGCLVFRDVPAFGFALRQGELTSVLPEITGAGVDGVRRGPFRIDLAADGSFRLSSDTLGFATPALGPAHMIVGGRELTFDAEVGCEILPDSELEASSPLASDGAGPVLAVTRRDRSGPEMTQRLRMHARWDAALVEFSYLHVPRPDPGMNSGLQIEWPTPASTAEIVRDHPYGVTRVSSPRPGRRKYPSGDWMTSPQWFEELGGSFTAGRFVDLCDASGRGLLIIHDGHQAFFRTTNGVRHLLTMYDPWDEEHDVVQGEATLCLVLHDRLTDTDRMRLAMEHRDPWFVPWPGVDSGPSLPDAFGGLHVDAKSVLATAFYRETEDRGDGLVNYAGRGMGYPFIVRLVEFDGEADEVRVRFPGRIAKAFRTNLMGEIEQELVPESCEAPPEMGFVAWSAVRLSMVGSPGTELEFAL